MVSILDYVSWDGRSGFIDAWKIKHFNAKGRKNGVCDLLSRTRVVSSIDPGHESTPLYIQGIHRKNGNPSFRVGKKLPGFRQLDSGDTDALRKDNAARKSSVPLAACVAV
jgi:hypothetical protein